MRNLKLGAKFLLGGLLLLLVPIALIGTISVVESNRSITAMARNDLSIIAAGLAGTLGVGVGEQLMTVRNIAASSSIIAASEKYFQEGEKNSRNEIALAEAELIRIKNVVGDRCSSVNLIDLKGIFYASSNRKANVGINVSERDYFKEAARGIPNAGSVVVSKSSGRVVLSTASPIYGSSGKTITGISMIAMEIKYLTDIVDAVKLGKTGYATIVKKDGITIAHPVRENIMKEDISKVEGMEPIARMVAQGDSGIVEYRRFGVSKVAGIAAVPLTGWSVFATIERNDLYSSAAALRNIIVAIGVAFLALASLFLLLFSLSITAPLGRIVGAAEEISAGNLTVEVEAGTRGDELGSLSRAFASMARSLKGTAEVAERIASGDLTVEVAPLSGRDLLGNAFSAMVAKLKSHMSGIGEGFAVLSSAGSEILAATTQVVSGTSETAAAISQTTATVEEVRQAARLSSEKAKKVSDNAQRVTEASKSGLQAVEETASVILHIRDQMESIAQTIVRLNEQSQSIGGIIASVTDLADQSKLLAVNASIEAARAGEQGKGFSVIAQEIKSLAEQSKQATIQVREILSEVQKATGAAVMATEQGTKAVEAGVRQSDQAGKAIGFLAESSIEATQAAIQIVASSEQQVIGMDQVGIAMANIGQAGAQTAASMRQAETAARNLHELGQRLKGLVEQYKV